MKQKNKKIYLCENCGNEFSIWSGRCEMCGEWNTLKELNLSDSDFIIKDKKSELKVEKLSNIKISKSLRIESGLSEFDRVLGGGIVIGSVILLGGEPGIGKSTLALQLLKKLDKVFYISAEESLEQIKIRAERLKISGDNHKFVASSEIEQIEREIYKEKPEIIIVDSIQTILMSSINSTPGSLVQVRECGIFLQRLAKKTNIAVLIIGHVTKEGTIAGPRLLEHIVDVVLYFEGERFHDARILRGIKNRFGTTNEVGIFKMAENGLVEIKNPSALFLAEHKNKAGSIVTVTVEGKRPILVEIQALVMPTKYGYPKRTSSGFDLNRLNLLAAVISRNTKINLNDSDIYLNVVGGLKLSEPATDAAVCAALMSSYKNKSLPDNICIYGEVGLLGEIRRVSRQAERDSETKNLGYKITEKIDDLNKLVSLLL